MGVEAFIYPALIVSVILGSVVVAEVLLRVLQIKSRLLVFTLVAGAAPSGIAITASQTAGAEWTYSLYSIGIATLCSCFVAALYVIFRLQR